MGEAACPSGIDADHRKPSLVQSRQGGTLVAAAGFQNDLRDGPLFQPLNQPHKAALVVAELVKRLFMDGHIQRGLTYIDPDPIHGRTPLG